MWFNNWKGNFATCLLDFFAAKICVRSCDRSCGFNTVPNTGAWQQKWKSIKKLSFRILPEKRGLNNQGIVDRLNLHCGLITWCKKRLKRCQTLRASKRATKWSSLNDCNAGNDFEDRQGGKSSKTFWTDLSYQVSRWQGSVARIHKKGSAHWCSYWMPLTSCSDDIQTLGLLVSAVRRMNDPW